jgi:hypothetical protein
MVLASSCLCCCPKAGFENSILKVNFMIQCGNLCIPVLLSLKQGAFPVLFVLQTILSSPYYHISRVNNFPIKHRHLYTFFFVMDMYIEVIRGIYLLKLWSLVSLTYRSPVFQFADCVARRECKFNDKARQKAKVTCYKLTWSLR